MDQNLEWHQSHKTISYPFVGPVSDQLKRTVVDALIIDGERVDERVKLAQLIVPSWTAAAVSVALRYSSSNTDFFTDEYDTYLSTFGEYGVIRLSSATERKEVMLTVVISEVLGASITETGLLVGRCQEPGQAAVRSITFDVGKSTETITGDFGIEAGYNMTVVNDGTAQVPEATRTLSMHVVELSASAGAGAGKLPSDCAGDGGLRTINGVGPNDFGDFTLTTGDCHCIFVPSLEHDDELDVPIIVQMPNTLSMRNDCLACCDCDDYERSYAALNNIYVDGTLVGSTLGDMANTLGSVMGSMEFERDRRQSRRKALRLRPTPGWFVGTTITLINNPPIDMNVGAQELEIQGLLDGEEITDNMVGLLSKSCYVYNSGWKYGWQKFEVDEVFLEPTFKEDNGDYKMVVSLDLPSPYTSGMELKGTQYMSIFFELYVKDVSERKHENEIELSVSGPGYYTMSPYIVTKAEQILQPFNEEDDVT